MTTQELRELDAWIAEHVMGWAVDLAAGRRKHGPGFLGKIIADDYTTWKKVPNYSSDPTAAMDVLKKCAEKDIVIAVEKKKGENCWTVGFIQWDDEAIWNQKSGETLELAICLFAKQLFSQTTK